MSERRKGSPVEEGKGSFLPKGEIEDNILSGQVSLTLLFGRVFGIRSFLAYALWHLPCRIRRGAAAGVDKHGARGGRVG